MFELEVSLEKTYLPQMTVVGHSSYTHTHTYMCAHIHVRTHTCAPTYTSGYLLTDGIYCAGEETAPQPASGTAGRGGQEVEKPKRGGARTTLKATTNVTEKAHARGRAAKYVRT